MDSAVRGAGAARDDRQRLRRQSIDPFIGRNRLAGFGIGSHRRPITLLLDFFIGNGAFDHQNKRIQLSGFRLIPEFHEIIADFVSQHRVVQMNLWKTGNGAQQHVFNAGLRRRR